jgi:hypothetical protein
MYRISESIKSETILIDCLLYELGWLTAEWLHLSESEGSTSRLIDCTPIWSGGEIGGICLHKYPTQRESRRSILYIESTLIGDNSWKAKIDLTTPLHELAGKFIVFRKAVDDRSLDPILAYGVDGFAPRIARMDDEWEIKISSDLSKSPEPIVLSLELSNSLCRIGGEIVVIESGLTNCYDDIEIFGDEITESFFLMSSPERGVDIWETCCIWFFSDGIYDFSSCPILANTGILSIDWMVSDGCRPARIFASEFDSG